MKKTFVLLVCLLSLVILLGSSRPARTAPANVIELKLASLVPPVHTMNRSIITPWIKEVEQRTQGRVKVSIFPAETLGKARDDYDLAARGVAEVAEFVHAYTPGRFPLSSVMDLPLGVPSSKIGCRIFWELYEKYMKQEYSDVKLLCLFTTEPGQIAMTKKLVKTMSDLKGMRLRSPGPRQTALLRAFGASPLTIPGPDMYDALQKGMADGALLPISGVRDFKVEELIKYTTIGNFYALPNGIVMNLNTWKSLPPDIQKIIDETTGLRLAEKGGEAFDRTGAQVQEEQRKRGAEYYQLPPAEMKIFREKFKVVTDAWVAEMESKGLPGKKVFEEATSLVQKYSK